MRRFLLLWLMLLAIEVIVGVAVSLGVFRALDARFEPFLTALVAPAAQAALLLWIFPGLRDPGFGAPGPAFRSPVTASAAMVLLVGVAALSVFVVSRTMPARAFDVVRGVMCLAGAGAFAVAAGRKLRGAAIAASAMAIAGLTAGRAEAIAGRILPAQPVAVRWLVYGVASSAIVLVLLFRALEPLRASCRDAATLLEWSIAPAMLAAIIVVAGLFSRPWLEAPWRLAAEASGLAACGLGLLASVAALQRGR